MSAPALTRPGRQKSRRRREPVAWAGRVVVLVLYGLPLVWVVLTSLKSQTDALSRDALIFFSPTLDAYREVMANPALASSLQQSFLIASGTTALVIFAAAPLAYALARVPGRISAAVLGLLVFLQMIPQTAGLASLYSVYASLHLIDNTFGLVVANATGLLPWAAVLLRPFFAAIPPSLEEAAAIDGAGRLRTFVAVVLPISVNGMATVAAVMFLVSWGEFVNAITLLLSPDKYPISALIAQQTSGYGVDWPGLMAFAVILSIPLLVVYLFSFRLLKEGIAVGSVK